MPRPRERRHQRESRVHEKHLGEPTKTGHGRLYLLALLALCVASFVVYKLTTKETSGHSSSPGIVLGPPVDFYLNRSAVPVWQWTPGRPFAEEADRFAHPVILRNAAPAQWLARRKWTPDFLGSRVKQFHGVYSNTNRWFGPYFDERKPLARHARRANPYRTDVTLSGVDLVRHMKSSALIRKKYIYYSGSVDQLGEWAIDDIQPLDELLKLNPAISSVNVWLGPPNVIAHCHYDGYHNFYVQLHGRKRFWLAPPSAWPWLQPAPFLHPGHAQCQVNLSKRDDSAIAADSVELLEVELKPGDLLYMPPLWFHHVQSLDARWGGQSMKGGGGVSVGSTVSGVWSGGGGGGVSLVGEYSQ